MANLSIFEARLAALEQQASDAEMKSTTFWLLFNGTLVFFMQCGFGMLEAGTVSAKNTQNIMLKNLFDASLACLAWWAVGHGLAYEGGSGFIGFEPGLSFFSHGLEDNSAADWAFFWFQFTFAAASATIVSGAVAERTQLNAYVIFSACITCVIYPVVVHWVWSDDGWLSRSNKDAFLGGVLDFAGSGVVHLTGGVAGLCGAIVVGPREGRFDPEHKIPMPLPGHSSVLQVLGTFILWTGWYGFNMGSTLDLSNAEAGRAGRIAVCTTLAASSGGAVAVCINHWLSPADDWDVSAMCSGILAGLVSITAGCSSIPTWAAVIHGSIGGLVFTYASRLVLKCKIDDPLDAFAVHGACGAWGVIAASLFSKEEYVNIRPHSRDGRGLFHGGVELFGAAVICVIVVTAWTAALSLTIFLLLAKAGKLRAIEQHDGPLERMDQSTHVSGPYIPARQRANAPVAATWDTQQ